MSVKKLLGNLKKIGGKGNEGSTSPDDSFSTSQDLGAKGILIRDRLLGLGQEMFHAQKEFNAFTKVPEADELLNDIDEHPHFFVLACIMDRQIKAERAWLIPYRIHKKIGDYSFQALSGLSLLEIHRLMSEPEALHRFVDIMSRLFYLGITRIRDVYGGDASLIWKGKPSSAEVIYRFLEFDGIGPKIASMAANILAREFKVPFADYYSIDISADVHVKRVFARLGFCNPDPTVEQVVYKARALYPQFPGIFDFSCWEIGRRWCKPKKPLCNECNMRDICPSASNAQSIH